MNKAMDNAAMHGVKTAVILASTRPGRAGEAVASWVLAQARQRRDGNYALVDLAAHDLPDIDEPIPPTAGRYTQLRTQAWADLVAGFDAYVIVTPEYNHSFPGALKNALDRVYAQWNDKAVAFVSYGADGGVRAVTALRQVVGALRMADVGAQVALSTRQDWDGFGGPFTPRPVHAEALTSTLDALAAWATALREVRLARTAPTATPPQPAPTG